MNLLLLASLAAADPRVSLTVERVPAGNALAVQVTHGGPGPITVASCQTLQVEIFDATTERWTPSSGNPCLRTEAAMALAPGEHSFNVPLAVEASALIRVVLVYGLGCREGLTLDEAGCTRYEAALSGSLTAFPEENR
ncbi:MAG: hypothetical protein JXB39_04745 [Deltaproteobacteria bacterium]|nr:hypothetical protein [Deltaproteobacteria bacterium]